MSAKVIAMHPQAPLLEPLDIPRALDAILEAANSLLREELIITAFQADIVTARPVLWIKDCSRVRNLARVGVASYDRVGHNEDGAYRVGVFERCGVTVQWMERITSCAA